MSGRKVRIDCCGWVEEKIEGGGVGWMEGGGGGGSIGLGVWS